MPVQNLLMKILRRNYRLFIILFIIFASFVSVTNYLENWWVILIGAALGLIGALVVKKKNIDMNKQLIWIPLLVVLISRSFIVFQEIPFSPDSGLYQYAIQNLWSGPAWITYAFDPGTLFIGSFLMWMGISSKLSVSILVLIGELLLVWSVIIFTRRIFDKTSGFFAGLVVALSLTHLTYVVNLDVVSLWGATIFMMAMYFIVARDQNKYNLPLFLLAILLALIQRQVFIVLLIVLLFSIFFKGIDYKKFKIKKGWSVDIISFFLILVVAVAVYIPLWDQIIYPLITHGDLNFIGEKPIDWLMYLFHLSLWIPGLMIVMFKRTKSMDLIWFWIFGSLLMIILGLSTEVIAILDIALLIFASEGVKRVMFKAGTIGKYVGIFYLVASVLIFSYTLYETKPLVSINNYKQIDSFSGITGLEKSAKIVVTDDDLVPFVLGLSERVVIADSIYTTQNRWTKEEWKLFKKANDIALMSTVLERYEKPIYIYGRLDLSTNRCFRKEENMLFRYIC